MADYAAGSSAQAPAVDAADLKSAEEKFELGVQCIKVRTCQFSVLPRIE